MADTDRDWEHFGHTDPYWAVVTKERFHRENLDDRALAEFYASGEQYVAWALETIRTHLDAGFRPARALDFGCGVGRMAIPLARKCESVVGVDVSESMLREACARADEQQLANVSWVRGDDELSGVAGRFDLINSYIVLQHIPCDRGQRIVKRLVELLNDGGVGVIHLTYSRASLGADPFPAWPASAPMYSAAPFRELRFCLSVLRRAIPRRVRYLLRKIGRPVEPEMQMNPYTLNPLLHIMQFSGVRRFHVEFTDHTGQYGVILFFRKAHDDTYCALGA